MSLAEEVSKEFGKQMLRWAEVNRPEVWKEMNGDGRRVFSVLKEREGVAVCPVDLPSGKSALLLFVGDEVVLAVRGDFSSNGSLEKLEWGTPYPAMSYAPGTIRRALRRLVN